MIVFLKSEWLFLFLIFPLFSILKYFKVLSSFKLYLNLLKWNADSLNIKEKNKFASSLLYKIPLLLAISTSIIAIAEPCIYQTKKTYTSKGSSVMFLLDISPSMAVQDVDNLSRLNVAKNIIKNMLTTLEGHSVGLILFAQKAYFIMVPTIDFATFLLQVDSIELAGVKDGTDINSALTLSLANIKESIASLNLVLLTDGESNKNAIIEDSILNLLKLKNVKLNIIKLGVEGYANIDYFDKENQKQYSGTYYTKTNENTLKAIASSLDGCFVSIKSLKDVNNINRSLKLYHKTEAMPWIKTERKELSFYFNFATVIFVLISWSIARIFMRLT